MTLIELLYNIVENPKHLQYYLDLKDFFPEKEIKEAIDYLYANSNNAEQDQS